MRGTTTVAALVAAALLATLTAAPPAVAAPGYTTAYRTIPGHGGTPLKALVYQPKGKGPFPLIVMPASWSLFHAEYAGAAAKFAATGYVVVAYTSRGFWDSEGRIEIAGRPDVGDVSKVIDWSLRNTRADRRRIGAAGISYGAGISLLGAAHDPRIRAVSAMSGWASLPDSLYQNQTVSEQTAALLLTAGHLTGDPGEDFLTVQDGYLKDKFGTAVKLASIRGAAHYVKKINANKPAIMLANGWQDGIFPPAQYVDFYNRLKVPKRLTFQAGDHGTPEALGALGLPNETWTQTLKWFDRHLRGRQNGIGAAGPVALKPNNGGKWVYFPSWRAQTTQTRKYTLPKRKRIAAGVNTVADSGIVEATGIAAQAGIHWTIRPSQVNRANALVHRTPVLKKRAIVSGAPMLRTTLTPSARNTTIFAYLYDEAPDGTARLITHAPYTLRNVPPGRPHPLTLPLQPIRWTVPKTHRLTLVIDTVDPRYRTTATESTTLTLTTTTLTIPYS
ncbi:CocE/NonD family hydrolase [Actinocorallia sp. A-T 12471]|uniref:CocE/NonD family hydrolase n=1 Tax=Actinocorallia sp. A-T 12471 TaxID=3089813 RepID=UPI0029D263A2|nr:CocE/NonD family hydrolase [Actinocorallia sp. A-T 12471]MDX6738298.1 CocE/NonD family hydrolase [Actinocorallia sp. A-T 12471]